MLQYVVRGSSAVSRKANRVIVAPRSLAVSDGLAPLCTPRPDAIAQIPASTRAHCCPAVRGVTALVTIPPCLHGYVLTRLSDRKSTRLNSSHVEISYAVFC